jgi:hypothetical protein
MRVARVLRGVGWWLTFVWLLAAFFFVIGETLDDPGGCSAVGLVACWLVPLAVLVATAWWRPGAVRTPLVWSVSLPVAYAASALVDRASWATFHDRVGPIGAILVMVIGLALAVLGRHPDSTLEAGWAMVALAVLPGLVLLVVGSLMVSLVAASLPVLVGGLFYVAAGMLTPAPKLGVPV